MTQPHKKRVFISYRSTDHAQVDALVSDLNSSGEVEVWLDRQKLKGGQAWWDTILNAIENCDVVIAALSPAALTSDACNKERAYGLALGLPLIPVRIDPKLKMETLPAELSSRQILTYNGGKREFDALMEAVRAVGTYPGKPNPAPQRPAPPVNVQPRPPYAVIAIGIALAIAVFLITRAIAPIDPPTPTPVSSSTTSSSTTAPAETTAPSTDGLPAALIYEGADALTVLLTDSADLNGVILRITAAEVTVSSDFDFVITEAARLGAGLCLRYVRASGQTPPLPRDCNPDRVFTRRLADADVFWWDGGQNAARTIAVVQNGVQIVLCSPSSARCDLSGG